LQEALDMFTPPTCAATGAPSVALAASPELAALPPAHRLSLQLELHRPSPNEAWWAELRSNDGTPPLLFASLPALIGYIARLDQQPQTSGLR
jgi:hypothetical protein